MLRIDGIEMVIRFHNEEKGVVFCQLWRAKKGLG